MANDEKGIEAGRAAKSRFSLAILAALQVEHAQIVLRRRVIRRQVNRAGLGRKRAVIVAARVEEPRHLVLSPRVGRVLGHRSL